jgi:small subunit ribosomal protein S3
MGQKVHPKAFRLALTKAWNSKWFAGRDYARLLKEDTQIRKTITDQLKDAGVSRVEIERGANTVTVTIATSRPGVVIGRGGAGVEVLRKSLARVVQVKTKGALKLNIEEVGRPNLDAQIVVKGMIDQIQKRMPFRRILRTTVEQVQRAGADGVRVMLSGRLNGAEIARTEQLAWGSIPLQTLRADIDFGRGAARTTYGAIGVKVWIYKGDVFEQPNISAHRFPIGQGRGN